MKSLPFVPHLFLHVRLQCDRTIGEIGDDHVELGTAVLRRLRLELLEHFETVVE